MTRNPPKLDLPTHVTSFFVCYYFLYPIPSCGIHFPSGWIHPLVFLSEGSVFSKFLVFISLTVLFVWTLTWLFSWVWNYRLYYFFLSVLKYYYLCASIVADDWTPIGLIIVPLKVFSFVSWGFPSFSPFSWCSVVSLQYFSRGLCLYFGSWCTLSIWGFIFFISGEFFNIILFFVLWSVFFSDDYHILELFILSKVVFHIFHVFNALWYNLNDFLRSVFQFTKFIFLFVFCALSHIIVLFSIDSVLIPEFFFKFSTFHNTLLLPCGITLFFIRWMVKNIYFKVLFELLLCPKLFGYDLLLHLQTFMASDFLHCLQSFHLSS